MNEARRSRVWDGEVDGGEDAKKVVGKSYKLPSARVRH